MNKIIENVWSKYDTDGNGFLDIEETKKYTIETLKQVKGDEFVPPTDDELNAAYSQFDKNGDNKIEKAEMAKFIRAKLGVPDAEEKK